MTRLKCRPTMWVTSGQAASWLTVNCMRQPCLQDFPLSVLLILLLAGLRSAGAFMRLSGIAVLLSSRAIAAVDTPLMPGACICADHGVLWCHKKRCWHDLPPLQAMQRQRSSRTASYAITSYCSVAAQSSAVESTSLDVIHTACWDIGFFL